MLCLACFGATVHSHRPVLTWPLVSSTRTLLLLQVKPYTTSTFTSRSGVLTVTAILGLFSNERAPAIIIIPVAHKSRPEALF
ncbi:uncharacterized protein M421DRAFT_330306 [Didymella exigua CBS 183.55]|uniref:Uncharacterized protein n=1 Tax=Didymella exigua CBS 183.55 TaxID=1150837 RepID=A0A6A5R6B1_9PLEO|nr:uncharacterized protein M421DRAFT_330306 [Didymella exigua CBS 183.55]KAF1923252.1 hypothetical protein M421DRAFT_330306 [Didymella exigua CBS 183.55]